MVVFNPTKREIGAKIVYYGPALCGKTTNLQYVHRKLNPKQRGDLVSLATKDDRTLFFDFLPLDLGTVRGFKTRFHLYTVPGQVYYVSTRRAVLTGVDGVVFVADSQDEKMTENIESLEDLEKNLSYYGKKLEELPMILQYNKRDLEKLSSIKELNARLNKRDLPFIEASAVTGKGVMETLTMVSKAVLENLEDSSKRPKMGVGARRPAPRVPSVAEAKPAVPKAPPPRPAVAEEPLPKMAREETIRQIEEPKIRTPMEIAPVPIEEEEIEEIEELDEIDETPPRRSVEMKTSLEEGDALSGEETLALDESEVDVTQEALEFGEAEEIELETEEGPLEVGEEAEAVEDSLEIEEGVAELEREEAVPELEEEVEAIEEEVEAIEEEAESIPLEMEPSGEEMTLEAEEEGAGLEELIEEHIPSKPIQPEAFELPSEPKLSADVARETLEEVGGIEIEHVGAPQKISATSIKLPLRLRLTESNKQVKLTLVIQLEELLIQ